MRLSKQGHASTFANLPALADDSGLVVDALQGQPGIVSARYAGLKASNQDNIDKLLKEMHDIPETERKAHFYCALAFVRFAADPAPLICQARWDGQILTQQRGERGFGYDPIFYVQEENCSAAELSVLQKNKLSHRAQALRQFYHQFQHLLASS